MSVLTSYKNTRQVRIILLPLDIETMIIYIKWATVEMLYVPTKIAYWKNIYQHKCDSCS